MCAKRRSVVFSLMVTVSVLLVVALAFGNPPVDKKPFKGGASGGTAVDKGSGVTHKEIDQPNMKDFRKLRQRQRVLQSGKDGMLTADMITTAAKTGTDTVLVILVEFGGTDTFTWTKVFQPGIPWGRQTPMNGRGRSGTVRRLSRKPGSLHTRVRSQSDRPSGFSR